MVRRIQVTLLSAAVLMAAWRPGVHAASPFLQTLVQTTGGVVIAYGTNASSLQAATVVRDAIRQIPGQSAWNGLRPAAEFDADTCAVTGQTHVIAVGTLADNAALRGRNWLPTWWMDRDWYYSTYAHKLTPQQTGLPYQPTTGFIAGGYGEWASSEKRIGYVEVDRSFYMMEWMVRSRLRSLGVDVNYQAAGVDPWPKAFELNDIPAYGQGAAMTETKWPSYPKHFPLRLMVRVTGTGDSGVVGAARAFAERAMLCGATLNGATADSGPAMFTLTAARYAAQLPFAPPDNVAGYTYLGWLLPDAFDYDGFKKNAKVAAQAMFRVKYKTSFGITSFWTTPHRRSGEFEIVAAKMASAADAQTALANIDAAVKAKQGYKDGRIKNWGIGANGQYLYLQSIPDGTALLDAYKSLAAW